MFKEELNPVETIILRTLKSLKIEWDAEIVWSSTPFSGEWGFGTAIGFQAAAKDAAAKDSGVKNIPQRAQEIAQALVKAIGAPAGFVSVEAVRGYINLSIDPQVYARRVVDTILADGENFARGDAKTEKVMVEYSAPNTHKAFHVGHLRNVILGGAMANIFEFAGYETVRANYWGDIGWHVIKWLWCYLRFHKDEEPQGDRTRWMQEIYSQATQLVEDQPEMEEEARKLYKRWDARDPELIALWERTRSWSIEGIMQIYEVLGEHFDVFFFESEVEEPGKKLVEELITRNIAVDDRPNGGTVAIKLDELLGLDKETFRVLVVLRSDGSSLYATKDLHLAIKKFDEWNIDRSIYVIDVRQSLYMKQIFKTLEIMGFKQSLNCFHLAYEIVNLPGDVTMSSREGTVVMFDDLLQEAVKRARDIVQQKNPGLSEDLKAKVALSVALGGLKYPLLAVDTNKVATFDWESALNFEGQASPYIQYAHVRANSILARAGDIPAPVSPAYTLEAAEITLLDRLSRLPETVQRAAQDYKPLHLANYVYDLAREFTNFYQRCPVLRADENMRNFRLRLTAAARQTLKNSLALLGIQAPDVM
ncbi:MAG: arginine--tRNA ligase [Chloroflexi bacterium]|nr:arginine--tRNA ligase [Chloroflexota bacterium]